MTNHAREQIDLAGIWQIAFDPEDLGIRQGWPGADWPQARSLPIHVPQIWNIDYPDAEGVGFYRTIFTVPPDWRDRVALLHFEGVIYRCEVWVNGRHAGGHEGGYTPFDIDINQFVQMGAENSLVVRVAALSKKKSIDGMQLQHAPLSKQSWYYVYGGIWGGVSLVACPQVACQKVSPNPNLQRESVQLEIGIRNRRDECRQVELNIKIADPRGETVHTQQSRIPALPGDTLFNYSIRLPRPLAWNCEQPNLYHLETKVIDEDGLIDIYQTYFGMRDFTVRDGTFYLNGEPIYIRGVLLQPNFPVNLITHPNHEMMVREITLMKEAGFNLLRTHLQPAAPEYLDLADRLGMLIYAETSLGWIRDNPRLVDHGRREIEAMIELDRSHPSVVLWGVYNENPTASAINGEVLARYARALDPTRVIVEDSGGSLAIDQDFGWIDRAAVIPAWEAQPQRIIDIHLYLGSPTPGTIYQWLSTLGSGVSSRVLVDEQFGSLAVVDEFDRECRSYKGQIFVSELGCGGMADLDEQVAGFGGKEELLDARELKTLRDSLNNGFQARHLERIFGSPRRLYQEAQELQVIGNTQQVEALLINPRVSGYMITQINDVAWEFHAGLLDVWRKPKLAYYAAQKVNQLNVIVLRAARPTATVGESVSVDLTLVSRQPLHSNTHIQLSVTDPSHQEIASYVEPIPFHPGIHPLKGLRVELHQPGTFQMIARLVLHGETLFETTETILGLEVADWQDLHVKVRCLGRLPVSATIPWLAPDNPATSGFNRSTVYLAALPATLTAEEWETLCQAVESGSVAVIGALRPDYNTAISAFSRHGLDLKLYFGIGSWMGCYHWAPQSDLFAGMPAGGLVKKPYNGIIPKYVFSEMGGEILAGSLRNTQSRQEAPRMLWYSDIEVVRLGKGAVIFCQYRVFENMTDNPLAARMAYNLLAYANRLAASL